MRRVGALTNTLSRHTMQTVARALEQGHTLAISLAQWGASVAMEVVSRRKSEVRVPWLHSLATQEEDREDQTDTEGEETEEEEESETEEKKFSEVAALPGPQGLLGNVAHTLQKALQTTILAVTWAPAAVLGMAGRVLHLTPARAVTSTKGRAMSLSDALKGVTDNVVDTVVHYVPVSPTPGKLLVSQGGLDRADKVDLTEGAADLSFPSGNPPPGLSALPPCRHTAPLPAPGG
ncbi:Perilipin-1 [Saguinus oedipus]|uniref:Perilipin-1 n=1 Tax=Saguinus oedipus TaxID=9490 RepID=A0ABQ9VDN7_SAGOE|nr:Perilipin-1 [Saguinus oedipus]